MRIPVYRFTSLVLLGISVWVTVACAHAAEPQLSISDVTVSEDSCSSPEAVFTVSISKRPNQNVSVGYATADGSAKAGNDYTAVNGTLKFPRGSKMSQTITVPISDVLIPGVSKNFFVDLNHAVNATFSRRKGTGTIQAPAVAKCQSCGLSCDDGDACTSDSCSATLGCQHVNGSATAKPYCALAGAGNTPEPDPNFAACNAAGKWIDSDGDGFSDAAEIQGYIDVNGNGVYDAGVDVPLPGADPNKPDVYLHYDYMAASDHDHNPPPQTIQWIVDAFAAHGATLHIDPVHNAIPEQKVTTLLYGAPPDYALDPACGGDDSTGGAVTMHTLAQQYLGNLAYAYRYIVFAHYSSCPDAAHCSKCQADPECGGGTPPGFGAIGNAQIDGFYGIVSFGALQDAGISIPAESWSGVAMHELGHNLGLLHGGPVCDNQKPNYISVMNYSFDTSGIPVGGSPGDTLPQACTTDADCSASAHCSSTTNTCFRIDYSNQQLPDLNEASLDETAGVYSALTSTDISVFYVNGVQLVSIPTNGTPIDWNQDGVIEQNVQADLNGDQQCARWEGLHAAHGR